MARMKRWVLTIGVHEALEHLLLEVGFLDAAEDTGTDSRLMLLRFYPPVPEPDQLGSVARPQAVVLSLTRTAQLCQDGPQHSELFIGRREEAHLGDINKSHGVTDACKLVCAVNKHLQEHVRLEQGRSQWMIGSQE